MMRLAGELGLPLVTVVDTAGAHLAGEAERLGLPGEIARSIEDMGALVVPTVAVVDGQGAGGAAIAWMAADTVLATPDSFVFLSNLPTLVLGTSVDERIRRRAATTWPPCRPGSRGWPGGERRALGLRHHAGQRALLPLRVGNADHGGLGHAGVRHDLVLELHRADPLAARLDHVLGAVGDLACSPRVTT
jgi:hypothetical protein